MLVMSNTSSPVIRRSSVLLCSGVKIDKAAVDWGLCWVPGSPGRARSLTHPLSLTDSSSFNSRDCEVPEYKVKRIEIFDQDSRVKYSAPADHLKVGMVESGVVMRVPEGFERISIKTLVGDVNLSWVGEGCKKVSIDTVAENGSECNEIKAARLESRIVVDSAIDVLSVETLMLDGEKGILFTEKAMVREVYLGSVGGAEVIMRGEVKVLTIGSMLPDAVIRIENPSQLSFLSVAERVYDAEILQRLKEGKESIKGLQFGKA